MHESLVFLEEVSALWYLLTGDIWDLEQRISELL